MALKKFFVATLFIGFLALNSQAMAEEYQPSEFLGLDLSKAMLSPKRLGPDAEFARVPIEANADHGSGVQARAVPAEPEVAVRKVKTVRVVEEPHAPARAKGALSTLAPSRPARRHTNPLDANAADRRVQTRTQTWPCKSGGICNWQR
jgi:hypothetical protein